MPKRRWIYAAAGLMLCAWASVCAAADAQFIVDQFGTDKGLPESTVLTVTQTRDGYLWVGTLNGLARFDGIHFTTFDENNTPGLKSSRIVRLFEDSQSNLWIGTETAGVALADKQGKVTSLDLGQAAGPQGRLMGACEDASGAVWLCTADGQLARYRDAKKIYARALGSGSRQSLIAEDSGLVWVGANSPAVGGFQLLAFGPIVPSATANIPPVAVGGRPGNLDFLLTSRNGGYWRLINGQIERCRASDVRICGSYPRKFGITSACEDLQGNLILGTDGGGVYWFDDKGSFSRIGSEQGLSHSSVLSLCVDREGCLWVGLNGGGLNRVRRHVFGVLEASRGLVVQSVCEGPDGGMWIGYNGDRIDHWAGGISRQFTNLTEQSASPVRAVLVDRDHQIWAGTYGQGLLRFEGGAFAPASGAESLVNPLISVLHQDRRGWLWVGTEGGLARWDGRDWRTFSTLDGLSPNAVQAVADDADGNLWIGTDGGGLNRLRDGRVSLFTRTNGLPSDRVSALYADAEGVLWVGTSSGLARFHKDRWTRFTKAEGLPCASISYVLEDGLGFLWLGSNAGLIRIKKQSLNDFAASAPGSLAFRAYGAQDGLPTAECTFGSQPAACRARDGKLWFSTIKGLVWLDPAKLPFNTNQVPVVIESASLDGRPQSIHSFRGTPAQSVLVPPGGERLEIQFTSLNLAAADRARFKYWLEGHEHDWSPQLPPNVRAAYYSKLPPGQYHFHVKACNEDGVWSQTAATLAVIVLPPFYRTWWFLSATALGLLGMIVGAVHYVSTQKLQRQLAVLRQHEALEHERARIARDLHDQLGANLTQVALLGEMAESDKDLPAEVETHSRQISQTARETTRALDEIVWTVNPANDTLDGLINYICKYAQEYLELAGLRYRLEVPSQLPAIPISPELRHNVFLVAKESVNNVVKHARATSVWLRLRLDAEQCVLEIEDDGRGISAADEQKGRNGLRNMRKRMEDIGGCFSFEPAPTGGTIIRLTAPLRTE